MKFHNPKALFWISLAVFIGGAIPILLYWYYFVRPPAVSVQEAKQILTNSAAVLMDVRPQSVYAANHIPGAENCPFTAIMALEDKSESPAFLQNKKPLLICESGLSSALAVQKLRALGYQGALNIRGGMLAWNTAAGTEPSRSMTLLEQTLATSLVFLIKPIYMLLCFILILILWRQSASDLVYFRWGLIVWWLGENACSVNYLFFAKDSDLWEYLHNYGMAAGLAIMAYAVIEGLDKRLIKFTAPKERCAFLGLCRTCYKYADVPCALQRLFHVTIPGLILFSLMPLTASLIPNSYATKIFGTDQHYSHMMSCQLFEDRYCAMLSLVLLVLSWLILLFKRPDPLPLSKILFAASLGPLGFGLMRLFLFRVYQENLAWLDIWEEFTELVFIAGIAVTLWVFRRSLLEKSAPAQPVEVPAQA